MSRHFIEKQLLLNMLCLPKDLIEHELKAYCFHDKVYVKAVQVRKNVNTLIRKACSRVSGFGYHDEEINTTSHWEFAFTSDRNERTQLHAVNCCRCGNYVVFDNMFDTNTNFNHLVCECASPLIVDLDLDDLDLSCNRRNWMNEDINEDYENELHQYLEHNE